MQDYIWIDGKKIEIRKLKKQVGTKKFAELLNREIEKTIRKYKVYLKSFSRIVGEEFLDMLDVRDCLEVEINELAKMKSADGVKKKVEELDKEFKALKPKIQKRFSGLSEWPEYPKSFWWRHLKSA